MSGFHGLIKSFENSPRLKALDVVVVTADPAVYNSKDLPTAVAARRLISEVDVLEFKSVKNSRIRENERGAVFPKDSMMKWFAYDDYGYDQALLIDADIINLTDAGDIFDYLDDADVAGAPLFPPSLKSSFEGSHREDGTTEELLTFMSSGWRDEKLNSGVLCFNSRLMSSAVRNGLISIAEEEAFVNEQVVLRRWIRSQDDVRFRKISPEYNFNSYYLRELAGQDGRLIRDNIKFLHFVGRNKPWRKEGVSELPWVSQLWAKYGEVEAAAPMSG